MANTPSRHVNSRGRFSRTGLRQAKWRRYGVGACASAGLLAVTLMLAPLLFAQNTPQITAVDPTSGKVDDSVTVMGSNLGKASVAAVFLSDDKSDYKATVGDQADDKIVIKVPQVKAGSYNISVQVGNSIFIKPVKFTVQ
jgi:hypothetical protein